MSIGFSLNFKEKRAGTKYRTTRLFSSITFRFFSFEQKDIKNLFTMKHLKFSNFLGSFATPGAQSQLRHSTKNTKELSQRGRIQVRVVPLSLCFFVVCRLVVDDLNALSLRLFLHHSTASYITCCLILVRGQAGN